MIITEIFFAITLLVIAAIDWQHRYIYTVHLVFAFFIAALHHICKDYTSYFIGAVAGFLIGYAIYKIALWYYKEEAFGFGDVLLLGVLGFYFGWPSFINYFAVTYLVFGWLAIFSLIFVSWKDFKKISLPMAPIYVSGAFLFKFWGCPTLLEAYYDTCIYISAAIYKVTMFFVLL